MRTVRLYGALLGAAVRAQAQYRANLAILLVGGMAYQASGFAFIWVVLDRFGAVGGWTLGEVAFLYALRLTAHGVMIVFFNQLNTIDELVREGEFDRFLVRPVNPLVQLLTRRMRLTSVGDLIGGLLLLGVSVTLVDVHWSPLAVAYLLAAILGGALVEASVLLALGSLSFRLLMTSGARFVGDEMFGLFSSYPLKIFPTGARFVMTFVVPLAFVAYIPASVLLSRTGELMVPAAVAYAAPALGVVLIYLAYRLWMWQIRHYQSSGH